MAKTNIQNITTTQTFQNWFDKTNEMVDIFKSSALTASVTGDITTGNAILEGDFTAEIFKADTQVQTDSIISYTGGEAVSFGSHIEVNSATEKVAATFSFASSGAFTRYTDGTNSWDVGMEDSTSRNFLINTGTTPYKFSLTPAGELTVPNIVTVEDIVVGGDLSVDGDMDINNLTANNVFAIGELTTAYSASDLKLKENLNVIDNALERVSKISGYTFNYIGKEEVATGVVAQEIEKVLPGIVYDVTNDNDETFKAVRYGNIVGLLIEAIKELKDEVERLKDASTN